MPMVLAMKVSLAQSIADDDRNAGLQRRGTNPYIQDSCPIE